MEIKENGFYQESENCKSSHKKKKKKQAANLYKVES